MAERLRLGVPFFYKPNWIAGPYYISNVIAALNLLSNDIKPEVIIYFDSKKSIRFLKELDYPYISFVKRKTAFNRITNKLSRILIKRNLFVKRLSPLKIDVLFPAVDNDFFLNIPIAKRIYWIPDFQEHFYPEFFSKEIIADRKKIHRSIIDKNAKIIFSSLSAQKNFSDIYPKASNKTFVLPFAVSHSENYKEIDINQLLKKFSLPPQYFFCANQFWAHKNHITILKALALLKNEGKKITVVFSGNQDDARNPGFFTDLMQYVTDNNLQEQTHFLGFIERNEQLVIMKNAKAIIQPSLFEGWSTVVEDAKSLNKTVILSDIPVHREQIKSNVFFFEPLVESTLAKQLENCEGVMEEPVDYNKARRIFAETFHSILEKTRGCAERH